MSLPNTLRLTGRSLSDPTYPNHPMPGDHLTDQIVVASVIWREADADNPMDGDEFTVLLLGPAPPFYTVATVQAFAPGQYKVIVAVEHRNIVDAVNGDEFPNPDPDHPHLMVGPRADGYIDMGGEV